MSFDPEKLDLMRYLRPKPPSAEEKMYGTFNRRMIAASLDSLLITAIIAPVVDYFFIQAYGMPTADIQGIAQHAAEQTNSVDAIRVFMEGLQSSGHLERWVMNMRWQFYAFAIYTVICWHYWSATPGKMLCRLKVVDAKTHGRMGDWQSILRVVGYIVSALPFAAGFFWIGLNKKRRGWHDYLSGTEVILAPRGKTTSTLEVDHPSSFQAPSEVE